MKKIMTLALVAAIVLSLGITSALAETDTATQPHGARFVDADKDGVCDVCDSADKDGDGVCDACPFSGVRPQDGTGRRTGRNGGSRGASFVDADGDGVCDNCPNGGTRPQNGAGAPRGRMGGRSK